MPGRYGAAVGKAEQRSAWERVVAYHEAQLTELFEHVSTAADRYRAGEIDVFAIDEIIHHYHRAAQELWKFCWSARPGSNVQAVARIIEQTAADDQGPVDWWERGTPRNKRLGDR